MRLIDADALREVLETAVPVSPITQQYNKEDVIRAIMDAPTIAHGTESIMIKWTPDLDKLAQDVAFRGLNEFSFMGKSIREWVEIILEQTSRRWVSVEDRLPEYTGWYLTYHHKINLCVVSWFTGDGWEDGDWGAYEDGWVSHWMLLPEDPEEVSGDA